MPHNLDYSTPLNRPRLVPYIPFVIPAATILSIRLFFSIAANLIATAQRPADVIEYARLLWFWENRLIHALFMIMDVTLVLLILFSVLAIIPKSRYWLNARVPGWTFLLILNWLVAIGVGMAPIRR